MAKLEDFKKRYVTSASFQSGDDILVTDENIEHLRQALKDKNFEWVSGSQIVEGESFQPNIIITLDELNSRFIPLNEAHNYTSCKRAINYIFVDY